MIKKQKDQKYSHLPAKYWALFLASCICLSAALWTEGSPPGHLKRYVMDLERVPGVPLPPLCQPSKQSEGEMLKERHHLFREMSLGHLLRPVRPPPTTAQVRTVRKPGDEVLPILEQWGRLICDYRGINLATIKELVEAEHMGQMLNFIAGSLWVSLLDLLWGFNHMVLTQRASELLSLITSLGYLSPTVMQF